MIFVPSGPNNMPGSFGVSCSGVLGCFLGGGAGGRGGSWRNVVWLARMMKFLHARRYMKTCAFWENERHAHHHLFVGEKYLAR